MNLWSISFAFRLGLGFHALNNEGAEGSNLMQPRRIDAGKVTYDGISGAIVRRHIMQNLVDICRADSISCLPVSEALHPDRGPLGILKCAKDLGKTKLTKLNPQDLYLAVRKAVQSCAILDIGGFLAPFSEGKDAQGATAAKAAAPEETLQASLAEIGGKNDGGAPYTVKRDSVFDVAWLISEQPQDLAITQHAAYRPSGAQSLFSQTMRSNIYAGVVRAELHRIGADDYWYLHSNDQPRLAIPESERRRRQKALIRSITNFIAAPTGARVAAWAPHVFLTEGAVLLTSDRTAPFVSPIKVDVANPRPIIADSGYTESMKALENKTTCWVWSFSTAKELIEKEAAIVEHLSDHETQASKQ